MMRELSTAQVDAGPGRVSLTAGRGGPSEDARSTWRAAFARVGARAHRISGLVVAPSGSAG
jgi:hypothetical protein